MAFPHGRLIEDALTPFLWIGGAMAPRDPKQPDPEVVGV